jgi:hypothetical protein
LLEFNTPLTANGGVPGSGDTIAVEVFGQPDFLSNSANQSASASATTLSATHVFGQGDDVISNNCDLE